MAIPLRVFVSREHPLDDPSPLRSVLQFERKPLDWRVLADGEPPERDWAIKGWLGMAHVTLLAGIGGIGKTLMGQMIGSALTIGRTFISEIPQPRPVLMWAAEDDHDELWRRQHAIATHFGTSLQHFAGKFIVESYADRDCTVMDLDIGGRLVETPMLEELREQIRDYAAEVVILDNAARLFGGKESDRNQVTRFVAALNGVASGAAVLLLAHPGRAIGSEFSGSSAWENSARARMFLTDRQPDEPPSENEEPTSDVRYLAKRKTNYSIRDICTFRYEGGVLVAREPIGGGTFAYLDERREDRIVMEAFAKLTNGLNQQPTDGSSSPNYLPTLIQRFSLSDGCSKRNLDKAMRRLMKDGKLQREEIGRYGNRNPRYGLILGPNATT